MLMGSLGQQNRLVELAVGSYLPCFKQVLAVTLVYPFVLVEASKVKVEVFAFAKAHVSEKTEVFL